MRKKTKQSVDASNVKDAWEALFKSQKTNSLEELNKDGWLDIHELSKKLNISRTGAIHRMKGLGLEEKKFSILWTDGKVRSILFFRIK